MASAAAFFDLDKTIIATSSTLALGRTFYDSGMISRRTVVKGAYARLAYHLGRVDEERMARLRDDMARMIAGWDVETVNAIVGEAFRDLIDPLVYEEAATLIEEHHNAGRSVVIVSSSGEEVVGPIGEMLGADHVVATRMVVEDGRYTGELAFYSFGPFKAQTVRELAAAHGWPLKDCYAYSDSATDLPMLTTAIPCRCGPGSFAGVGRWRSGSPERPSSWQRPDGAPAADPRHVSGDVGPGSRSPGP
jgi:HAD superfamily hydrolase (TIGR01490 family)